MNLYLHNRIYKNENGKAVSYARLLDNTFNVTATNEDFGLFDNPFETLSAEDFIATGDGGYTLTDAAKASEAARAFTGVSEEIANFTVFAQNGKAYSIMIDTEKDIRGHGITMDYTYNANYFFDVAEFKELDGRIAPYPTAPEHAALKEALAAASAAQSYTYHVKEDAEYNFYVTEKAIYCDEESGDLGYYLYTDGLVHEIYLQNEQLILGDPLQIPSGSGSEYTTTSDLASLKPNFGAFAAELFEPKGNGVFEMHAEEVALLRETAQFLWNFNDYMTMSFAQSITITVKDNVLAEVSIETKLYMFTTTFTLTYSDWNETELPLPLTVPGGSATPAGTYPAKYYGKFAGSTWQNVAYAAEIDASAISFSIGGAPATVTNVNYDASADKILLTVNGTACNITPAGDKQTVDAITFAANDNQSLSSATLDRVPEGGGTGSVTIPEMFYGAFEGDDGEGEAKKHYEVTIAESGITATIDGEAITVTVTGYNVRYKELAIVFNGTPCNLSVSLDQNNKPLSISIMSTNDFSVNLTLYAVNAGGQQPAAGKEKFYGTYEGTYTPYDGETRTYHVTITADGIAVSINGTEATVTEVGYDEDMEEFTFKVNGAAYSISANSDDAPLTEIALWFEIFHSAILTRTA